MGRYTKIKIISRENKKGLSGVPFYKNIKYAGSKKKVKFQFQKHAIFDKDTINETPFCDEKYLKDYSIKYDFIIKNYGKFIFNIEKFEKK